MMVLLHKPVDLSMLRPARQAGKAKRDRETLPRRSRIGVKSGRNRRLRRENPA